MNVRYALYARKSSEQEDRQVVSIPSQISELTALSNKMQLTITVELNEAKSAKNPGRIEFNHMLDLVKSGKINGIVAWHPDRLSRNLKDAGDIVTLMDRGMLYQVVTPTQTFKNNPMDKFMLGFLMLQAKLENDNKGVNVKRGLRTKAKNGWFPSSWTKPGYMWDKMAERGNKTILKDEVRYPLIKQCWDLMLTGAYTVPQILKILNEDMGYRGIIRRSMGGKPMGRSQLYEVFADPFYYGWYQYRDSDGVMTWQKGNHEPMITEEEFNKVQVRLGRTCRQRFRKHDFDLTGIIRCGECDGLVSAEEKWQIICPDCKHKFSSNGKQECPNCHRLIELMDNPKILHYIYYHCNKRKCQSCTQKSIELTDFDKQVKDTLSNLRVSQRFINWAVNHLRELNDEEIKTHTATIASLQLAHSDCINRLDNLVKLKISSQNSDGSLLTDEEFKSQKSLISKERVGIEEQLGLQGKRVDNWVDEVERKFDFATHALYKYENGSPAIRREIMTIICSNLELFNKKLRFDLQNEYQFVENATKNEPSTMESFEPKKMPNSSIKLEDYWAQNPTLLPG